MKRLLELLFGLLEIIGVILELWFGLPLLLMGYVASCFFVFDHLRINDTDSQICIALAPFFILLYFLSKNGNRWGKHDTPIEKDIDKRIIK